MTTPLRLAALLCACLIPAASIHAATFYVSAAAANDNGNGSSAQPKKTIQAGAALLSAQGGDTLIIRPGTYSGSVNRIDGLIAGRASAWNVVKAEADGSVRITAPLTMPLGDHYLQFEGLEWSGAEEKSVNGRFVKFLRCGFANGPVTGNTVTLGIGTNDATPGAQYILVEDSFAYGHGGRYNVLVYNADRVVLRRVVGRHESGWSDTDGNPQAIVSLYNSTNVLTQNLLLLDTRPPGYFEAALYHPSNSRASAHIYNTGAVILNVASGIGWDDANASSDNRLEDSIIYNADSAISINGAAHSGTLQRLTIGHITASGINDYHDSGGFTLTNSMLFDISGNNLRSIVHSGNACSAASCSGELNQNPFIGGLQWLPRIEAGSILASAGPGGTRIGATVVKKLGVSGTLHGDPGYDQPTTDNLWPWPQEDRIKTRLCAESAVTTGFCAASTLTRYVWEMLGNPIPSDVYATDTIFANGFE